MNRYQRILVALAMINALLMVLLPPFNHIPLVKGSLPTFDGFYPLFTGLGRHPLNNELLFLELSLVGANFLAAWLALQHRGDDEIPRFRYSRGILLFAACNLAIILAFPPFEPYSGLHITRSGTFDSFYFVFGDRSHRAIYIPMLYLEVVFVAINALALWLLFNATERSEELVRRRILHLAEELPDDALEQIAHTLEHRVETHHRAAGTATLPRRRT